MNSIITVKQVDVGYNKKTVISDVNIDGMKGQIICLLGPNGAGKSTILRTLAGILAPINGCITIDGQEIQRIKKKEISKKMALVLTDTVSPGLMTVKELVSMGRTPYTNFIGKLTENDKKIVQNALETVDAVHLSNRYYDELSDGEKQKVMIARALVQEPELIILDEPTSHLDIKHKVEVIQVLQRLVNEKHITVILSLHDIDLAIKGCQTVLLVNDGKVVAQGTPEEIVKKGCIQKLYGIKGARYNELFGSVELNGSKAHDVFVTGGNATGIHIYRALARKGFGMVAGILHENDSDTQVAQSICNEVIKEEPFSVIRSTTIDKAMRFVEEVQCVVDTGFPIGEGNEGNCEVIKRALEMKKVVYSIRTKECCKTLYGDKANSIICCETITILLNQLEKKVEVMNL